MLWFVAPTLVTLEVSFIACVFMVAQVFCQLDPVERANSCAALSLAQRPHHSCIPQSCLVTDRFPCNLKALAFGSSG